MMESNDEGVIRCLQNTLLASVQHSVQSAGTDLLGQGPLDLIPLQHFLFRQHCRSSATFFVKSGLVPFMAYKWSVFFSLTRYTFPTSPLPSNLIFWNEDGPTSTCFRQSHILRSGKVTHRLDFDRIRAIRPPERLLGSELTAAAI